MRLQGTAIRSRVEILPIESITVIPSSLINSIFFHLFSSFIRHQPSYPCYASTFLANCHKKKSWFNWKSNTALLVEDCRCIYPQQDELLALESVLQHEDSAELDSVEQFDSAALASSLASADTSLISTPQQLLADLAFPPAIFLIKFVILNSSFIITSSKFLMRIAPESTLLPLQAQAKLVLHECC